MTQDLNLKARKTISKAFFVGTYQKNYECEKVKFPLKV